MSELTETIEMAINSAAAAAWHEGFAAGWAECSDPGAFVNDVWDAKTRNPYEAASA